MGKFQLLKDVNENHQDLEGYMTQWAIDMGVQIDTSMFLLKSVMEDVVKTTFHPGGITA